MKLKGNGITKKIDNVGRIVIPINYRERLDLQYDDIVEIYLLDDGIFIKKIEE